VELKLVEVEVEEVLELVEVLVVKPAIPAAKKGSPNIGCPQNPA
jgi:hypothetical protein